MPDVASQFGRSEGMAHLEALEMLSSNRPKASPKFESEFLAAIAEVDTERLEDGDFKQLLLAIIKKIKLPYEPKSLLDCDNVCYILSHLFLNRKSKPDLLGLMARLLTSCSPTLFSLSSNSQPAPYRFIRFFKSLKLFRQSRNWRIFCS